MLSKSMIEKETILSVCRVSPDPEPGDRFSAVRTADGEGDRIRLPSDGAVVCCGAVNADEILCRTEDGRVWFSIRDGWGKKDGVLYGLRIGMTFDFGRPTAPGSVPDESAETEPCRSWGGALLRQAKKDALGKIGAVLRREGGAAIRPSDPEGRR